MTTDERGYRTVERRASVSFEVRGSEFIGTVAPVESMGAAEEFIESIEIAYPDASHHVPAYRIRSEPFREWSSDAGEPSGSAGQPILNVINGQELENVVLVVTRYFGGTKLGYGGLVSAYTEAAKRAIEASTIVERQPTTPVIAVVEYNDSGTVRGILESEAIEFQVDYESRVTFHIRVPDRRLDSVLERLRNATRGRVEITVE